MSTLNLRLTDQIDQQLSREARLENRTRSEVAREALAWYLTEMEKNRFMNQLVEEARAAYSNKDIRREALEIAEEFLPAENEALDAAEGRKTGKSKPGSHGEKWWK
ncbi:MAG: CopG family transcriptional regulator [Pseudomonadota bacterium]